MRDNKLVEADNNQTNGLTIFPIKLIAGAETIAKFSLRFNAMRLG